MFSETTPDFVISTKPFVSSVRDSVCTLRHSLARPSVAVVRDSVATTNLNPLILSLASLEFTDIPKALTQFLSVHHQTPAACSLLLKTLLDKLSSLNSSSETNNPSFKLMKENFLTLIYKFYQFLTSNHDPSFTVNTDVQIQLAQAIIKAKALPPSSLLFLKKFPESEWQTCLQLLCFQAMHTRSQECLAAEKFLAEFYEDYESCFLSTGSNSVSGIVNGGGDSKSTAADLENTETFEDARLREMWLINRSRFECIWQSLFSVLSCKEFSQHEADDGEWVKHHVLRSHSHKPMTAKATIISKAARITCAIIQLSVEYGDFEYAWRCFEQFDHYCSINGDYLICAKDWWFVQLESIIMCRIAIESSQTHLNDNIWVARAYALYNKILCFYLKITKLGGGKTNIGALQPSIIQYYYPAFMATFAQIIYVTYSSKIITTVPVNDLKKGHADGATSSNNRNRLITLNKLNSLTRLCRDMIDIAENNHDHFPIPSDYILNLLVKSYLEYSVFSDTLCSEPYDMIFTIIKHADKRRKKGILMNNIFSALSKSRVSLFTDGRLLRKSSNYEVLADQNRDNNKVLDDCAENYISNETFGNLVQLCSLVQDQENLQMLNRRFGCSMHSEQVDEQQQCENQALKMLEQVLEESVAEFTESC